MFKKSASVVRRIVVWIISAIVEKLKRSDNMTGNKM